MIKVEYFNRKADNFYTKTFDNNADSIPFLRELPSNDTVLVCLDDRELFMNNSDIIGLLKKGDFFYDAWGKRIVAQTPEDCDDANYIRGRYISYKDNEEVTI